MGVMGHRSMTMSEAVAALSSFMEALTILSCFYWISTSWPTMTAPTVAVWAAGSAVTGGTLEAFGKCQ